MTLLKKKNTSLSEKLKGAVTDLSVDIFGYEKMISKNIITHTNQYAEKLNLPVDRLYLKIVRNRETVRAYLYDKQKALLLIPTEDLKLFFITSGEAELMGSSINISISIGQYLKDFARAHKIDEKSLRIWIHTKKENVNVMAFEHQDFIQTISLNSLIKYFKK